MSEVHTADRIVVVELVGPVLVDVAFSLALRIDVSLLVIDVSLVQSSKQ